MTFLDEALVEFKSGKGGSGAVSFHREKFVPLGGPNGADGGRGGDLIVVADRNQRTLYEMQRLGRYHAADGTHGVGNKRGKNGKALEIKLPVGTIISNSVTGDILVDLKFHGQTLVLLQGGKGGSGNQHYANSVRQAPNFAQKGGPEEVVLAQLELKLIADVGLIGLPNAGKSTLISRISSAKPKIADYPFTTIVPNLGVVKINEDTFVVADTPGLIEGASKGIGLGHQFLKHVERNRVLVHIVDAMPIDGSNPLSNFHIIENELRLYSQELWERPRLVAINKIDIVPSDQYNALRQSFESLELPLFPISAATGQGIEPLLQAISQKLKEMPVDEEDVVLTPKPEAKTEDDWEIVVEDDGKYRLIGKRLERLVAMTDLQNSEAVGNLHQRLERVGVIKKLRELGTVQGDSVMVGDAEFDFEDPR